ncbi:outer membrane beta-barrel protein [Spartinivicinus poritis]|uniref:Outer membrane beta-barrel protein n=1 Tax=Spartinivicinus poritis TaxID=2994640 RepID=A0ABT5UH36_9GAMM|nr:outer membrane beta-barrel protein [Spartinivicinus sp. A2-2]MDE1465681.1 outer membrane beta-barrel protein [Spartinivicinus sp. A2-2]
MRKTVLAIAIVSTFTSPVFAEKSGYYLGFSAGQADYDSLTFSAISATGLDVYNGSSFNTSSTDKDGIFKLFGGYRFNKHLAIEADYTKFSDTRSNLSANSNDGYRATNRVDNELEGFGLKAVGFYPITDSFEIKASAGLLRWKLDEKSNAVREVNLSDTSETNTFKQGYNSTERGTSITVGLGANYNINDHFTVGLNWERINDVGEKRFAFGETDIDTYTASLQYNF